jgi:hypothetical protein
MFNYQHQWLIPPPIENDLNLRDLFVQQKPTALNMSVLDDVNYSYKFKAGIAHQCGWHKGSHQQHHLLDKGVGVLVRQIIGTELSAIPHDPLPATIMTCPTTMGELFSTVISSVSIPE